MEPDRNENPRERGPGARARRRKKPSIETKIEGVRVETKIKGGGAIETKIKRAM